MSDRQPWERPEEPECRDIFAAELIRDPGPEGQNPVASEIGTWVYSVIERLRARFGKHKSPESVESQARGSVIAGTATATAVGALEGTLKGKSLEGALKEAQILETYASARQKNAEAEKLEVETEHLRQEAALDRLERTISLIQSLGAEVGIARTPNGELAITVGETLVGELPGLSAPVETLGGLIPSGHPEGAHTNETTSDTPGPSNSSSDNSRE
jgi:hypothetical protein